MMVRAVVVCCACAKRAEYDAKLSASLDHESGSYGSTTTRVELDFDPPAPVGWRFDHWTDRYWCSSACSDAKPYG